MSMNPNGPGHPDSYYVATAKGIVDYPALDGELTADVCVIGGGFTGVSAALNLAEHGLDVVLLEGNRVGSGASGRNGGQAQTGFGGEIEDLEFLVGPDTARAVS